MIKKLAFQRATPAELERFWRLVHRRGPNDCWPWLGSGENGYGRFKFKGHMAVASRFIYEQTHGPVGDLDVAHTCEQKCMNLLHMRAITHFKNVTAGPGRATRIFDTHCARGHEYTAENTMLRADGNRQCKECFRNRPTSKRSQAIRNQLLQDLRKLQ